MYKTEYNSIFGKLTLTADEGGFSGLYFQNHKYFPDTSNYKYDNSKFYHVLLWLDNYFSGKNSPLSGISFNLKGTDFQKRIWNMLLEIPGGQTVSYKQIAQKIGIKGFRAIGSAIGHNPALIIIPCHRVIKSNGDLGGYSAGIEMKKKLLEFEAANLRAGQF